MDESVDRPKDRETTAIQRYVGGMQRPCVARRRHFFTDLCLMCCRVG